MESNPKAFKYKSIFPVEGSTGNEAIGEKVLSVR